MPYINFSEDDLYHANTADLVSFLQNRGEQVKKVGSTYKYIYTVGGGTHDSVTIHGGKWYDHKNQRGGYAVKFLQEFLGFSFQNSVIELLGGHCSAQTVRPVPREPPKPIVKPFELPEANSDMRRVFAYLTKQRFISPDIISHFAHEHKIYEDSKYHNAVFVGTDENGTPKQASVRSTLSFGKTFRITVANSDTKYSLDNLFAKMYEDRAKESITERNFAMLSAKYQEEQTQLENKKQELQAKLDKSAQDADGAEKWLSLVRKYTELTELTAPLLNELIDQIVIHQVVTDDNGGRTQEIEIFYRFVGKID